MDMRLKKRIAEFLLKIPPFRLLHMGNYIRQIYFWRSCRKLNMKDFKDALDAGCGHGHYALRFAIKFPWITVTGMDVKKNIPENNLPSNFIFRQLSLLDLSERATYDFIYSVDVLEHIQNNRIVLQNFYRSLKKNGYLYVHMPAKRKPHATSIFPERFFADFNKWVDNEHIGEHYSLDELGQCLEEIGFTILNKEHTFGFLGKFVWELDRVTDNRFSLKLLLSPFLKTLGFLSTILKIKDGIGILVLAQKKNDLNEAFE